MKLNGVILLTDQGEIVENPDAVESVILILDVLSLKILIKEISKALTISLSGTLLNIILKKFSEKDNFLLGAMIDFPFLDLK